MIMDFTNWPVEKYLRPIFTVLRLLHTCCRDISLIKIFLVIRVQSMLVLYKKRHNSHFEMPAAGGTQTGLQLWINLARKDKMIEPRYQELLDADIPRAEKNGVQVKVIAGESMGVHSPVYIRAPTM